MINRRIHSLGGKASAKINGKRAVESGQLRIVCSEGGRRVYELYPEERRAIARRVSHVRWHVARKIVNPKCLLCRIS